MKPHLLYLLVLLPVLCVGQDSLSIQYYYQQAQELKYTHIPTSTSYLDSAIHIADKLPYDSITAELLRRKGINYKIIGDFDRALEIYDLALQRFERANSKHGQAATYNNIGITYWRKGNDSLALQYYVKAYEINTSLNDIAGLTKNCIAIGNFYNRKYDYKNAIENYNEALAYLIIKQNNALKAMLHKNIAAIYSHKVPDVNDSISYYNPELAIRYYQQSIDNYSTINDSVNVAGIYHSIGVIHENESEFALAEENYRRALSMRKRLNFTNDLGYSYYSLSNVKYKTNDFPVALSLLRKAKVLAWQNNDLRLQRNIERRLSDVYAKQGRIQASFDHFIAYDSLDNLLHNKETAKAIQELETKYETAKKEKDLVEAQIEIQRRTTERNGYLITLAVVLAFAIVLVLIYQQRQNALKDLRSREKDLYNKRVDELLLEQEVSSLNAMMDGQEQERQRLSRELHDRIGSLLTAIKFNVDHTNSEQQPTTELTQKIQEALEETRDLSHSLASGILAKFGLVAAIHDLKDSIQQEKGVEVEFIHQGLSERISRDIEIDLYRIIQELVSNTLKHAYAKRITIQLTMHDDALNLMYEDDGIGFDINAKKPGIGLQNIEARGKKHHAQLTIDTQPNHGMRAILDIPITYDEKITVS